MLNLIDEIAAARTTFGQAEAQAKYAVIHKLQLEQSRRTPNRQIASVLAFCYVVAVVLGASVARIFRRESPDPVIHALAATYSAVPEMVLHKAIELRAVLRHDLRGSALDLGCGDGHVGALLLRASKLARLDGVDVSPIARETLLSRGYSDFVAADIQALPHPSAAYDNIVSICVVEHVGDLHAVLREAHRVLRPGGWFVFTTPSPAFRESLIGYRFLNALKLRKWAQRFQRYRDVTAFHMHYHDAEGWERILLQTGFSEVIIDPIFTKGQLAAYDAMNIQVYYLPLYFYERLASALDRWPRVRRVMERAAAELCSFAASATATHETATHFCIACRKPPVE